MNKCIVDPDVQLLAGIAGTIISDFPLNEEWVGSPFAWIKQRPSRQVGAIGEMLVAGWLAEWGGSLQSAFGVIQRLVGNS